MAGSSLSRACTPRASTTTTRSRPRSTSLATPQQHRSKTACTATTSSPLPSKSSCAVQGHAAGNAGEAPACGFVPGAVTVELHDPANHSIDHEPRRHPRCPRPRFRGQQPRRAAHPGLLRRQRPRPLRLRSSRRRHGLPIGGLVDRAVDDPWLAQTLERSRAYPGEGDYIELERGYSTRRLREPVVAFSNADGGVILLGVEPDGTVVGVDQPTSADRLTAVPASGEEGVTRQGSRCRCGTRFVVQRRLR